MLASPHRAGAAHAGLDLVEDERDAGLVADLTHCLKVAFGRDNDAGLALDRLEDYGGDLLADLLEVLYCLPDVIRDAVADVLDLLNHRSVGSAVGALPADGDRAHGLPVEASYCGDEPAAARRDARELEGHLDRLGAAVREEAVLQVARGDGGHRLREVAAERIEQLLGVESLVVKLRLHHIEDLAVAVPEGEHAEAAQAVDELLALEPVAVGAAVLPLEDRALRGVRGDGLPVLEPARRYIVLELIEGLPHHSLLLCRGNVSGVSLDEPDDPVKGADYVFSAFCHSLACPAPCKSVHCS